MNLDWALKHGGQVDEEYNDRCQTLWRWCTCTVLLRVFTASRNYIYDLVIIQFLSSEQVTCKHKMIYSNFHWTVDRSTAQSCMYLERTALFVCCIFHVWLVTVTLDMHCTIGTVTWKQDRFSWSVEFYWQKHHLMSMEPLNVCSDETSFSRCLHCDSLVSYCSLTLIMIITAASLWLFCMFMILSPFFKRMRSSAVIL